MVDVLSLFKLLAVAFSDGRLTEEEIARIFELFFEVR